MKLGVYLTFLNKNGDLGIALPAGIVRLYKKDAGGTAQFLGSDRSTTRRATKRSACTSAIRSTSPLAASKRTSISSADGVFDSSYEFVISNAKTVPQDVVVVEPIPGEWKILSEEFSHTKRVPAERRPGTFAFRRTAKRR